MILQAKDVVNTIKETKFKHNYYNPQKPLIILDLSKQWPAYNKWNWSYFKTFVGDKK